jgi:hypothetical protein
MLNYQRVTTGTFTLHSLPMFTREITHMEAQGWIYLAASKMARGNSHRNQYHTGHP